MTHRLHILQPEQFMMQKRFGLPTFEQHCICSLRCKILDTLNKLFHEFFMVMNFKYMQFRVFIKFLKNKMNEQGTQKKHFEPSGAGDSPFYDFKMHFPYMGHK